MKKDRYKKQTQHNAMDIVIRGRRGGGRNPQLGASSLAQGKDLEGLATHSAILRPTPPLASQWMLARESGDSTWTYRVRTCILTGSRADSQAHWSSRSIFLANTKDGGIHETDVEGWTVFRVGSRSEDLKGREQCKQKHAAVTSKIFRKWLENCGLSRAQ